VNISERIFAQSWHLWTYLGVPGAILPEKFEAPSITFNEAMQMLKKEESQPDLDPTDEKRISDWAEKEYGSEFVFVTGLPEDKRPFYYKEGEWVLKDVSFKIEPKQRLLSLAQQALAKPLFYHLFAVTTIFKRVKF
jgi:hypothetical protein